MRRDAVSFCRAWIPRSSRHGAEWTCRQNADKAFKTALVKLKGKVMIRFGLLGCGKIVLRHARLLGEGYVQNGKLQAVCDRHGYQ